MPSDAEAAAGRALAARVWEFALGAATSLADKRDVRLVALGAEKSSCATHFGAPATQGNRPARLALDTAACQGMGALDPLAFSRAMFAQCRGEGAGAARPDKACELFLADTPQKERNPFALDAHAVIRSYAVGDAAAGTLSAQLLPPFGPDQRLLPVSTRSDSSLFHRDGKAQLVFISDVAFGGDCGGMPAASETRAAAALRKSTGGVPLPAGCAPWDAQRGTFVEQLLTRSRKPVALPADTRGKALRKVRIDGLVLPPESYRYADEVMEFLQEPPAPAGKGEIEFFF